MATGNPSMRDHIGAASSQFDNFPETKSIGIKSVMRLV